jgi:FkbM family methyltransferase
MALLQEGELQLSRLAAFAQRTVGRSRTAVRLATKIKNQCEMILAAHMSGGLAMSANGEEWLAGLIAPHCRNFVDVGANIGAWSVGFARRMAVQPQGLLFEPSPETATQLRMVLAKEGLGKLEVIERAVSDHSGQAMFHAEPGFSETSSLYAGANNYFPVIAVTLTTLDDELSARSFSDVDFLKIDAEGHDFYVLLGAQKYISSRRIKIIQFEYNGAWLHAGATLSRAFDFLGAHGYKVRLLKQGMLGDLDIRKTGEFFSYSNFAAYCPSELGEILDRQRHYSVL